MNISAFLVTAAGIAPMGALLGAIGMLLVHKNNAVKLLSEAQQIAQRTALDSANSALATVEKRCGRCEEKLNAIESVCEELITAAETVVEYVPVEKRAQVNAAIWAARRAI